MDEIMPQPFLGIMLLVIGFAILVAALVGCGWLLSAFLRCPKKLRMHGFTACFWGVLLAIQTGLLIREPNKSISAHLIVFISGLVLVPCWGQFTRRRRDHAQMVKPSAFLIRLGMQSIWGPLALVAFVLMLQNYGTQRFYQAVQERNVPKAIWLRDYGFGDNDYMRAPYGEYSRLDEAILNQDVDLVRVYLSVATLSSEDKNSSLNVAVKGNDTRITRMLLEEGADPNYRGSEYAPREPALYTAAAAGKVQQVQLLLQQGADRKQQCIYGGTAWDAAKQSKNRKVMALLAAKP